MENYIGKIIDNRYEIISLIGVGGMSNVYKAVDKQSGQEVAVKFLKEEFFENLLQSLNLSAIMALKERR